jgi:hypothetical protein
MRLNDLKLSLNAVPLSVMMASSRTFLTVETRLEKLLKVFSSPHGTHMKNGRYAISGIFSQMWPYCRRSIRA